MFWEEFDVNSFSYPQLLCLSRFQLFVLQSLLNCKCNRVAYGFPWWLFISSRIEMRCCNIFWMSRLETSKLFTHLVQVTQRLKITQKFLIEITFKHQANKFQKLFEFSRQNMPYFLCNIQGNFWRENHIILKA